MADDGGSMGERVDRPLRHVTLVRAIELASLAVFVAASVGFAIITLPYGTPDEPGHTVYAEAVSHGRLPTPEFSGRPAPPDATYPSPQAHHPPLYYAIVGGAWALSGRQPGLLAQIARALSVLAGIAALLLLRAAMHRAFPDRPIIVAAGFAIVVASTSFTYVMGSFNSDSLAVLAVCAALYLAVRALEDERPMRWMVALGACMGVGLLAKLTSVVIVVPIAIVAVYAARRERRGLLRAAGLALAALGVAAVISSPWFVRNQIVMGTPTFNCATRPVFQSASMLLPNWDAATLLTLITLEELTIAPWWPEWLLKTRGPVIGGLAFPESAEVSRPPWRVLLPLVVGVVGIWGAVRRLRDGEDEATDARRRAVLWMLLLLPLATTLGILQQMLLVDSVIMRWTGRYVGTMIPPLGMTLGLGFATLLPTRLRRALPVVALIAAVGLNAAALVEVLRFYESPPTIHRPRGVSMPASAVGRGEAAVHAADAREVGDHLHAIGERIDLRVGRVDPAHGHFDNREAKAQRDEDQFGVEGPALELLMGEDALDRLAREHLEAALRVVDA